MVFLLSFSPFVFFSPHSPMSMEANRIRVPEHRSGRVRFVACKGPTIHCSQPPTPKGPKVPDSCLGNFQTQKPEPTSTRSIGAPAANPWFFGVCGHVFTPFDPSSSCLKMQFLLVCKECLDPLGSFWFAPMVVEKFGRTNFCDTQRPRSSAKVVMDTTCFGITVLCQN